MASQLPDILKVKPQAILSNMDIDSHILEPEVSTARHMTFKLPKVGILDQGSQVQLGITVPQISGKDEAFFPGLTGIASLIEKAELEVAGKVLATSDDFAYYHTMRRSYKHPEERAFVDSLKEGVWADRVAFQTVGSTAGLLALRDVDYASASGNGTVPSHLKMTSSATTSPLFSLSLSQLFPAFTSKQLPLFAIKDHVLIKLTFRQQFPGSAVDRGLVFQCPSSVTDTNMPQFSINAANCKFVYDAIHYNQQTMADVSTRAMSDSGLSMIYEDLILTRATIGNTTAPSADTQSVTQSYDRQLATVGRTVRNILIHEKALNVAPTSPLLGQYGTVCSTAPDEIQIRVNDTPLFTNPIVRESEKMHQFGLVMDAPAQIPSLLYSKDNGSNKFSISGLPPNIGAVPITTSTVEGVCQSTLYGSCHYVGFDLTKSGANVLENGLEIKQKPIEVHRKVFRTTAGASSAGLPNNLSLETRFFTNVERTMLMRKGEVMVSA